MYEMFNISRRSGLAVDLLIWTGKGPINHAVLREMLYQGRGSIHIFNPFAAYSKT